MIENPVYDVIRGTNSPENNDVFKNSPLNDHEIFMQAMFSLIKELYVQNRNFMKLEFIGVFSGTKDDQECLECSIQSIARELAIIRSMLCRCMPENVVTSLLHDMMEKDEIKFRTGEDD